LSLPLSLSFLPLSLSSLSSPPLSSLSPLSLLLPPSLSLSSLLFSSLPLSLGFPLCQRCFTVLMVPVYSSFSPLLCSLSFSIPLSASRPTLTLTKVTTHHCFTHTHTHTHTNTHTYTVIIRTLITNDTVRFRWISYIRS